MTERRPLTKAENDACERFAELSRLAQKAQQAFAEEIGVTPAAVGHWLRAEIPIPLRRAPKIAALIGGRPEEICAEWVDYVAPYLSAAPSHSWRPDPEILGSAVELGRKAFVELDDDTFDPETHGDVVAEAYVFLASRRQNKATPSNIIDFAKALKKLGVRDGNERTGSTGSSNSKKGEAGSAEEAKAKRRRKNG